MSDEKSVGVHEVVGMLLEAEHANDVIAVAVVYVTRDSRITRRAAWSNSAASPLLLAGMTYLTSDICHIP